MKRLRHRALVDVSPLTIATDSSSPLPTTSTRRRLDNWVPATLSAGVAPFHYGLRKALQPKSFRSACRRPPDFGDFQHGRGWKDSVHQLLEAANIPPTHKANVFLTKEDALYLLEMVWLLTMFSKLREMGITTAQTTHESWRFAGKNMNCAWGFYFFSRHAANTNGNEFTIMETSPRMTVKPISLRGSSNYPTLFPKYRSKNYMKQVWTRFWSNNSRLAPQSLSGVLSLIPQILPKTKPTLWKLRRGSRQKKVSYRGAGSKSWNDMGHKTAGDVKRLDWLDQKFTQLGSQQEIHDMNSSDGRSVSSSRCRMFCADGSQLLLNLEEWILWSLFLVIDDDEGNFYVWKDSHLLVFYPWDALCGMADFLVWEPVVPRDIAFSLFTSIFNMHVLSI